MKNLLKYIAVAFGIALFAGCASQVSRPTEGDTANVVRGPVKVASVEIVLSDEAKEKLKDNLKFNLDTMKSTLMRSLEANELIDASSDKTLKITVFDIRVRSNFSAVMFGFMAGADIVAGTVTIKDAAQHVIDTYEVTASYALGGLAGGQDSARMDWLYEEFAKRTTKEMMGSSES